MENNEELNNVSTSNVPTRALSTTDYYWYNGTKIGINKKEGKRFILFKTSNELKLAVSAGSLKMIDQPKEVTLSSRIVKIKTNQKASISYESLNWASVADDSGTIKKNVNVIYDAPYFINENGEEIGLSHLFYVKLKDAGDIGKLTELATKCNIEVIGNNQYMPLWYTLACTNQSMGNALELANLFYETNLFAESHPDLMATILPACVNDPYFQNQWNLNNTGQNGGTEDLDIFYCGTRSQTQGASNVIVAVIDQGIQLNHPDLNVYSVSYDTETGTSPSVVRGSHGTSCAGIIGAKTNNALGVAGITPNSPLMSISHTLLLADIDYNQKMADGFNFAMNNGAWVISNSWFSTAQTAILTDAIQNTISNGRGGRVAWLYFQQETTIGTI